MKVLSLNWSVFLSDSTVAVSTGAIVDADSDAGAAAAAALLAIMTFGLLIGGVPGDDGVESGDAGAADGGGESLSLAFDFEASLYIPAFVAAARISRVSDSFGASVASSSLNFFIIDDADAVAISLRPVADVVFIAFEVS